MPCGAQVPNATNSGAEIDKTALAMATYFRRSHTRAKSIPSSRFLDCFARGVIDG
jgi:hypothetical protein